MRNMNGHRLNLIILILILISITSVNIIDASSDQYLINYNIPISNIDIFSCGNLNKTDSVYILKSNVSSNSSCFTIGAKGIILEGQGYSAYYSNTGTGYGIVNTGNYDNITIKDLALTQKSTATNSHAIYFKNVDNSKIQNISITTLGDFSYGIYLSSSNYNNFNNFDVYTSGATGYGIYTYLSGSNNFSGFDITTTATNGYGISAKSSSYNRYYDSNILTSGSNAHGIYIESGNYNNFLNNMISANGSGIYINSADYDTIRDGSIISKSSNDYYLRNTGAVNNFIDTNFTTRNIYYYDNKSGFNYEDNSILLNTTQIISPTKSLKITRKLINWDQTNITWQETVSASRRLNYIMSGLLANTDYSVWNGSFIGFNLTTDVDGNLPNFSINLTTSPKLIRVILK